MRGGLDFRVDREQHGPHARQHGTGAVEGPSPGHPARLLRNGRHAQGHGKAQVESDRRDDEKRRRDPRRKRQRQKAVQGAAAIVLRLPRRARDSTARMCIMPAAVFTRSGL